MNYSFSPRGICPTRMEIELEGNIIKSVNSIGGCNGNLKAIAALIQGKTVEEVVPILSGIRCGFKSTSCADQLSKGLLEAVNAEK